MKEMPLSSMPDWMENIETDDLIVAENNHQTSHYRSIFISDVHLGSRGAKADFLSEFLKYNQCEKLYLVGDIIDGWRLKKRIYWPQEHTNVIRRILTKAKRGTEVVFVTGNHDDFLRRYSGVDFGNILLTDEAVHQTVTGDSILVIHGDKYDSVIQTQKWLAVIGDWGYESLVVLNRYFNRIRHKCGLGYWSLSAFIKQKVKSAVSFITAYEEVVVQDCKKRGYKGVICGHIHHPEIRDIEGIEYLNCGDWVESCTAIVETQDGDMKLLQWVEIGHQTNS
ncbi:UDP-2,3-diacylglucosamine hydrolase [Hydrogenovibrio crunogenus]|uniref:UDP-2,3-diacylglucosamine hydrolase n=1 Tax=Hydrogenovibrio crunogenus TaxID=39765 RepID=A0A4P7P2S9_9GAMM|nr:UDP-2,3-diacylglucosamine diphosphatase [Hydrogenovibrio crunogenus]QBZ83632.1 UDP-2,3-diacylglucosamine hydrolase [Hydrogenovibrio crunogenus]RUM92315.1 MAG: UDP-2,3-diacylglucosamine diphosphatase [Thiomicrospira sp.]